MYWHRIIETSSRRLATAGVIRSERVPGKRQHAIHWRVVRTLAALSLYMSSAPIHAAPYTPAGDHVVLARLPQAQPALAPPTAPLDLSAALALARSQIDYASAQGDPRFLGYAEATLAPFSQDMSSPAANLLMARIEQQRHQFARARHRLTRLLEQSPNQGQAWLMLANIDRVQGRLDEARQDPVRCRPPPFCSVRPASRPSRASGSKPIAPCRPWHPARPPHRENPPSGWTP